MHKANRKRTSSHESIQRWSKRIEGWENSGLSQREYCRRENINPNSFNYWKRKLEEPQSPPGLTLIKLDTSEPLMSSPGRYSPPTSCPLRFWLKDFCIEVGEDFSPPALTRLIETLRRF